MAEQKDLVEKDFVAFPDVAADVLNALLFDGETGDIDKQLITMNIREEDEITVCELFDQYERKGIRKGIQVLIQTCRDMKLSFTETAERVKKGFELDETELQENMKLYWPE